MREEKDRIKEKTAEGLAEHAIAFLKLPTVYLWGGLGEIFTSKLLLEKQKEYPDFYTEQRCLELMKYVDKDVRGVDCSGLIKNYLMGGIDEFRLKPEFDWNSEMILARAVASGGLDEMPEKVGLGLYMPGHVGVYIGAGKVVEATSNPEFGNGVVETALTDRLWTRWFYVPTVDYD